MTRVSSFAIKNPVLQNIDRNVEFFNKNKHLLLHYVMSGLPRGKSHPGHPILGRHINQLASLVGLSPIIGGREWRLPDTQFFDVAKVENLQEIIYDFLFLYFKCSFIRQKLVIPRSTWMKLS